MDVSAEEGDAVVVAVPDGDDGTSADADNNVDASDANQLVDSVIRVSLAHARTHALTRRLGSLLDAPVDLGGLGDGIVDR